MNVCIAFICKSIFIYKEVAEMFMASDSVIHKAPEKSHSWVNDGSAPL